MTQWEYKIVTLAELVTMAAPPPRERPAGLRIHASAEIHAAAADVLTGLGDVGWELVGMYNHNDGTAFQLRRPRPSVLNAPHCARHALGKVCRECAPELCG